MSKVNCDLCGQLSHIISWWSEKSGKRGKAWFSRLISEQVAKLKCKYFANLLSGIKKNMAHLRAAVCCGGCQWCVPAHLAHGQNVSERNICWTEHLFPATAVASVAPFAPAFVCIWIVLSWIQKRFSLIGLGFNSTKLTFIVIVKDIYLCTAFLWCHHFYDQGNLACLACLSCFHLQVILSGFQNHLFQGIEHIQCAFSCRRRKCMRWR